MQPARLKKIQSLDYATSSSGGVANTTTTSGHQCAFVATSSTSARVGGRATIPTLMHSVSIVVDQATSNEDKPGIGVQFGSCGSSSSPRGSTSSGSSIDAEVAMQPQGRTSNEINTASTRARTTATTIAATAATTTAATTTTSTPSEPVDLEAFMLGLRSSGACQASPNVVTSDNESDNDDQDDNDDDHENADDYDDGLDDSADMDDNECLSSGLARRVVIVDEADKILMQRRSHSAEPQVLQRTLARFNACRPDAYCKSATTAAPEAPISNSASHFVALSSPASLPAPLDFGELIKPKSGGLTQRTRHSLATITTPRPGLKVGLCVSSKAGVSSGSELAEHGELSKLSMRRNTHHHVNFGALTMSTTNTTVISSAASSPSSSSSSSSPPPPPPPPPPSHVSHSSYSSQQALVMRASSTGTTVSSVGAQKRSNNQHQEVFSRYNNRHYNHPHQQQPRFNDSASISNNKTPSKLEQQIYRQPVASNERLSIQHRRQSLQLGLLSGVCRDASCSLTEEELRGEREFNEQVRNAAKSPDFVHAHQQLRQTAHLTSGSSTSSASFADSRRNSLFAPRKSCSPSTSASEQEARSQSISSTSCRESPAKFTAHRKEDDQPQVVLAPIESNKLHQLAPKSLSSASTRRRRVSFGAIDPIVLSQHQPDALSCGQHRDTANKSKAIDQSLGAALGKRQQRASICCSLWPENSGGGSGGQLESKLGSGILRKLERISGPSSISTINNNRPPQEALSSDTRQKIDYSNQSSAKSENRTESQSCTKEFKGTEVRVGSGQELVERKTLAAAMEQQRDKSAASDLTAFPRRARLASAGAESDAAAASALIASNLSKTSQPDDSSDVMTASHNKFPPPGRRQQSKSIAGPAIMGEKTDESRVQSIMANAKLRQEEFARLLEEHEQIVNEINRFETKISTAAAGQAELLKKKTQQQDASDQL